MLWFILQSRKIFSNLTNSVITLLPFQPASRCPLAALESVNFTVAIDMALYGFIVQIIVKAKRDWGFPKLCVRGVAQSVSIADLLSHCKNCIAN
ncbi:MAG: hypothetical protein ACI94O_002464 [Octadecabacter sp.]|jgi:hypothetical protein